MALFAVLSSLSTPAPDCSALSTRASTPERSGLDAAAAAVVVTAAAATEVVDVFALAAATGVTDVVLVATRVVVGPALVETPSEAAVVTVVSGAVLDTVVVSGLPQALSPIRSPPVMQPERRTMMGVRVMPPESAPSVNAVRARYEQTVRESQPDCASGTRLS
jgi:hypothetical protein